MKIKFLTISILFLALSCDFSIYRNEGLIFNENSFDTNYALWSQYQNRNYEFNQEYFDNSRGPMPKIKVEVSNDKILSWTIISNDIDENEIYVFKTITEIYEFIDNVVISCKESIESDHESSMYGAKIDIKYDEDYYYPMKVDCTGFYREDVMGGLSSHLQISEFKLK